MTDQPTTEQHTDDAAAPTGTPRADDTTVNGAADHGVTTPRPDPTETAAPDAGTHERPVGAAPADAAVTDTVIETGTDTATGSGPESAQEQTGAVAAADDIAPEADDTAAPSDPLPSDPLPSHDGPSPESSTTGVVPSEVSQADAAVTDVSSADVETTHTADVPSADVPAENVSSADVETAQPMGSTPSVSTRSESAQPESGQAESTQPEPGQPEPGQAVESGQVESTQAVESMGSPAAAGAGAGTGAPVPPAVTPASVAAAVSETSAAATPGDTPGRPRRDKPAPYVVDPALADTPQPTVRRASSDPGRWGRVDADGTVHVSTADGERAVGSWKAGEPQEGLAHFARRFDDVLTEVELIAARLASGHGDPKQLSATLRQHREALADAHVVGDLVGLQALLDHLLAKADQAIGVARQAREAARQESTARKQALVEEAEKIAEEATQWKAAGDRLREILDEWKTIRGVDRKTDDALWKRFGKARDAFNRRRGSHFAEMDRQRAAAKTRKEEIVAEAERISTSDEWGPTAGRYKQLMIDWKAAGRAPKDADDVLWQRFRAAQDAFFSRRSSAFTERDSELVENATKKDALLAEAERIDPAKGGVDAARAALHRIQERWDAIGHVPRERMREFEQRLRAVEERVRGAADAQWRRTDPETEARVAQFRERVEQFETQARKARAAGDERRAKQADAQAAQWREWLAAAEQAAADR